MWSGNLKTALSILRSAKWRSLLTMLGIVIGVSSVITVVSLGEGLKKQIVGQINQLGSDVVTVRSGKLVEHGGANSNRLNLLAFLNANTLTAEDVEALSTLPSAATVVPMEFVSSSVSSDGNTLNNIFVIGTNSDMPRVLRQSVEYGEFFRAGEQEQRYAVIGSNIAQQLFHEFNPVGHSVRILDESFIIRGVLETSSGGLLSVAQTDFNSAVFIPAPTARELTKQRTNILQILLKAKNANQVDATIAQANQALLKTHKGIEDFTVLKQYELLSIVGGVVNSITAFISGIAAISLLVGGIGIMGIMLVSVSERMREIGIRKAVGATNRQILNQFLVEGLALSIGGGLIGIAIALLINLALRLYTNLEPVVSIPVVLLAVSVSLAIGVIFSVIPALKAARKPPIEALRNE